MKFATSTRKPAMWENAYTSLGRQFYEHRLTEKWNRDLQNSEIDSEFMSTLYWGIFYQCSRFSYYKDHWLIVLEPKFPQVLTTLNSERHPNASTWG